MILVCLGQVSGAVGHWVENLADHEHQTFWEVEEEVAALLKTGIVLRVTFPALVAKAEFEVVRRSPVIPISAVGFVLAWQ